eukprot:evm.model.scf_361.3 EVM.evm.TU.scf_361.3   scf_361:28797-30611(+)
MFPTNPIVVLIPVFYMLFATLSLIWFTYIYSGIYTLLLQARENDSLQVVQPVIAVLMPSLDKIFGKPYAYSPTPTHVILVALFLVIYVQLDRVRRASERY